MKEVKNFEKYYATTCGKILSKARSCEMSTYLDTVGYKCVSIRNSQGEVKHVRVHRLVATTYIEFNTQDRSVQVNHIDGDKLNCCVRNLEIVTNKENTEHGYNNNLYTTRNKIVVDVFNRNMEFIFRCDSIRKCEEKTGLNRKLISLYIKNARNNNSDYIFVISHFDKPFRIKDCHGNDFRSSRQCSEYYGFGHRCFSEKIKNCDGILEYKNIKFEKYFVQ